MHSVEYGGLFCLSPSLDGPEVTDNDEFSVVVLKVPNHALVCWLCLTSCVWRQEEQGHILQTFHFGMSGAVVYDQRTLSPLSLIRLVELGDPFHQDLAWHPGFFVGIILCQEGLDIVKTPGLRRLADDQ